MSEPRFYHFVGPSPHHDRACIEARFAPAPGTYRLQPLEPLLIEAGFRLREVLPDEPLPLTEAVRRLAAALLARHKPWWSDHGSHDGLDWAAVQFPFPAIAAQTLAAAHRLLTAGEPAGRDDLGKIAGWLASVSKARVWMLGAAQMLDREAITPIGASEVFQVGQGANGVHCYRTGTELDAMTGHKLEEYKLRTVQLLRRLGLPTTKPVLVNGPDDVADAIAQVGLPCVVKPLNLLKGEGVAPGLTSEAEVAAAVRHVRQLTNLPA